MPPRPMIQGLKHFCIWLRIREVMRQRWYLSSVNDTSGSEPAVSLMPLVPHQQCCWYCWCSTSGAYDTSGAALAIDSVGAASVVLMTPLVRYDTAGAI
jgi:hypothetical protein